MKDKMSTLYAGPGVGWEGCLPQWWPKLGLHTFACIPVLAAENLGLAT